jgi:hypothetical protein
MFSKINNAVENADVKSSAVNAIEDTSGFSTVCALPFSKGKKKGLLGKKKKKVNSPKSSMKLNATNKKKFKEETLSLKRCNKIKETKTHWKKTEESFSKRLGDPSLKDILTKNYDTKTHQKINFILQSPKIHSVPEVGSNPSISITQKKKIGEPFPGHHSLQVHFSIDNDFDKLLFESLNSVLTLNDEITIQQMNDFSKYFKLQESNTYTIMQINNFKNVFKNSHLGKKITLSSPMLQKVKDDMGFIIKQILQTCHTKVVPEKEKTIKFPPKLTSIEDSNMSTAKDNMDASRPKLTPIVSMREINKSALKEQLPCIMTEKMVISLINMINRSSGNKEIAIKCNNFLYKYIGKSQDEFWEAFNQFAGDRENPDVIVDKRDPDSKNEKRSEIEEYEEGKSFNLE